MILTQNQDLRQTSDLNQYHTVTEVIIPITGDSNGYPTSSTVPDSEMALPTRRGIGRHPELKMATKTGSGFEFRLSDDVGIVSN